MKNSKKKYTNKERRKEQKVYTYRVRRRVYIRVKNKLANRPKYKRRKKKFYRDGTPKIIPKKTLRLPSNFSFIKNPNGVMKIFETLSVCANESLDVVFDFTGVESITPDAISLLLANVFKYRPYINIYGNRPLKKELDDLLLESGFYKMVGLVNYKSDRGLLGTHKSKVVDTEIAVEARILTSVKTFNDSTRKIRPLYRTLIECMANTRRHASEANQKESWWLSVYYDPVTRITSFSFCDMGVGIFKSAKLQNITKFAVKLGLTSNAEILKRILDGKIESSTGLPYRGKGLPKIYSDYKANFLRNLHIAANDTFADFDSGTFVVLKHELNGTFLHWEIVPD